jgi:hypothetical protein
MLNTMMAACGRRCSDELWASFDRPRVDSDRLIIDVMDEATVYGWEAPAEIAAEIEKLRDIRDAREVQRKAEEEAAFEVECEAENARLDGLFFEARRVALILPKSPPVSPIVT